MTYLFFMHSLLPFFSSLRSLAATDVLKLLQMLCNEGKAFPSQVQILPPEAMAVMANTFFNTFANMGFQNNLTNSTGSGMIAACRIAFDCVLMCRHWTPERP